MYVSYMLRYMRKSRVAVWKFRSVYERSEYEQEVPQAQIADQPTEPGRNHE